MAQRWIRPRPEPARPSNAAPAAPTPGDSTARVRSFLSQHPWLAEERTRVKPQPGAYEAQDFFAFMPGCAVSTPSYPTAGPPLLPAGSFSVPQEPYLGMFAPCDVFSAAVPELVKDSSCSSTSTASYMIPGLVEGATPAQWMKLQDAVFDCDAWDAQSGWDVDVVSAEAVRHDRLRELRSESTALSTVSFDAPSSAGSTLSPVQTDRSETVASTRGGGLSSRCASPLAIGAAAVVDDGQQLGATPTAGAGTLVCLGPQCHLSFPSAADLRAHVRAVHTHTCNWAGCRHPSFASRDGLAWHVQAEHLLVCPARGCTEAGSFAGARLLRSHIAVAHPESGGGDGVKEWQLAPATSVEVMRRSVSAQSARSSTTPVAAAAGPVDDVARKERSSVAVAKRRCQEQLRSVVEKKVRKNCIGNTKNTRGFAVDSISDLARTRPSKPADSLSFPLVFEHAVLPFLAALLPKWTGPRHVVSVTRGRTTGARRICIMTRREVSRARKITIAGHVGDLLPDKFRGSVSFVFSVGEVSRCWSRGLSWEQPDQVCAPRNPFHFRSPCMGDSIGTRGSGEVEESTATLGPCLDVSGGSFWLVNFHPFLEAYQSLPSVAVEHPSPYDRARCIDEGHDAMAAGADFKIGHVEVTSGLNLKTTRISHDPYWDDCLIDHPLVTTDWALVTARKSACDANILRRFPSETQPPLEEPLVRSVSTSRGPDGVVPGAAVFSSGRTSGHQRGQVCEIPAYVSGAENGTGKATREWFVEEPPPPWEDEEAWIRGGIGVWGDSGGAIVDAESSCLVGQLWARNNYWGPGPRHTYFTPVSDIFDDIQEKCGLQTRPQLPQTRDDGDRYPVYPSCRQCYDLRAYLDSRRSSRASLQSMIMYTGDADHDVTSVEAVSELATPHDYQRVTGVEEVGASFNNVLSPGDARLGPSTPLIAGDMRSPYPQSLDIDDAPKPHLKIANAVTLVPAKRSGPRAETNCVAFPTWAAPTSADPASKRRKTGW